VLLLTGWASKVLLVLSNDCLSRYPPVALQPSLGQFFSHVNEEWRNGYRTGVSLTSSPKLSNVVVVSVSGGIHDYQVLFLLPEYFHLYSWSLNLMHIWLCPIYVFFNDKMAFFASIWIQQNSHKN
jgi:hypothetical protein